MLKYIFTPRLNLIDVFIIAIITVLCSTHSWFWLLLSFPLAVISQSIQYRVLSD